MPSTYTLNNGIELIATGEQSGTWGDTTNTNLSLLDTALDGQVTVTLPSAGTSGAPNTLAISDGSASDGRNRMVIFNDGGDLGATAYVQLTPNDAEKIIYIRNDLAGSRSIILFQGTYSASNDYELPAGTTAVIYFDGAGSGAVAANVFNNAYFDSLRLGSVSVDKILDEDNMASDDASALATQQSIKAYVDSQVTAQDLDFGGDSGTGAVDLDSQTFTIAGTANEIETSASGQTLTVGLPDNVTITGDLTVDTNTLYVDSANNRVGIGLTSPLVPLQINMTDANFGVANLNTGIVQLGSTSTADDIAFGTIGAGPTFTEYMRIDNGTGNVGIGVTDPVGRLEVKNSGDDNGFEFLPAYSSNINLMNSYNRNTTTYYPLETRASYFMFKNGTSEAMRIDSNGNVGIGTSAPVNNSNRSTLGLQGVWGGQLDIMVGSTVHAQFGSDNFNTGLSARIQSQDGIVFRTNGNNERMRIDSSGNVGIGTVPDTDWYSGVTALQIDNAGSISQNGAPNGRLAIALNAKQTGSSYLTGWEYQTTDEATQYLQIEGSHIWKNAASGTADTAITWSERMRIDSSGNVGIGTSSPSYNLHVSGSEGILRLTSTSSGTNFDIGAGSAGQAFLFQRANSYMHFGTNNTERMRIDSSGNLLLGTTSTPANLTGDALVVGSGHSGISNTGSLIAPSIVSSGSLEFNFDGVSGTQRHGRITGNGSTSGGAYAGGLDFEYYAYSGTAYQWYTGMRISSAGMVGIGTTSPSAPLHVLSTSIPQANFAYDADRYVALTHSSIFNVSGAGQTNNLQIASRGQGGLNEITFFTGGTDASGTGENERMRIDSSGNLLVGKTSADNTTVGTTIYGGSSASMSIVRSGASQLVLNRLSNDGDMAVFRKDGSTVGSIGVDAGDLLIGTGDTGLRFNDGATEIIPRNTTGAQSAGLINLGNSSSRFKDLYLSGGVYLGGTGSANKLDDYEEGTFTPNLGGSGSNPTATYSQQYGYYTKVGRMVYISLRVRASAYSGGSGNLQIYGLPFTPNTAAQHNIGGTFVSGPHWGASKTQFVPWVLDNGQAKVQFRGYENNAGNYDLSVSDYSANDYLDVNGWYFV